MYTITTNFSTYSCRKHCRLNNDFANAELVLEKKRGKRNKLSAGYQYFLFPRFFPSKASSMGRGNRDVFYWKTTSHSMAFYSGLKTSTLRRSLYEARYYVVLLTHKIHFV